MPCRANALSMTALFHGDRMESPPDRVPVRPAERPCLLPGVVAARARKPVEVGGGCGFPARTRGHEAPLPKRSPVPTWPFLSPRRTSHVESCATRREHLPAAHPGGRRVKGDREGVARDHGRGLARVWPSRPPTRFLSGPSFARRSRPASRRRSSSPPRRRDLAAQELFSGRSACTPPTTSSASSRRRAQERHCDRRRYLEGLGLGHNARAALITRGLAEMTRLGVALGAPLTFAGLAGLGDLVLTCTGDLSRNRRSAWPSRPGAR